jgi:hypothetical protein
LTLTKKKKNMIRDFKTFQTSMWKVVFVNRTTLHVPPTCWRVYRKHQQSFFKNIKHLLKYKNVRMNLTLTKKNHDKKTKTPWRT